jgi:hypothetical protein
MENMTTLDMLFIIDATGSMAPVIAGVKRHIQDLVDKIQADETNSTIRLGLVAYRDYDDNPMYETYPFSEDVQAFRDFLTNLRAMGGGDEAEDVLTGFEVATQMNWESQARMVVHFADAPCHGIDYHRGCVSDTYKQGDKYGRTSSSLLSHLKDGCMVNTYQFMHLNHKTADMIRKFKDEVANADWFLEGHLEMSRMDLMTDHLYQGSISSICRSRVLSDDTVMTQVPL